MGAKDWFAFAGRDFRDGVRALSLQQVGAYTLVLTLIYDAGGAIRDDDAALARALRCDVRVWRRMRADLLAAGKLHLTQDGRITNERAEREIARAAEISRIRGDARRSGHAKAKLSERRSSLVANDLHGTSAELLEEVSRKFERSSPNLSQNLPEKPNENNARHPSNANQFDAVLPITITKNKKEEKGLSQSSGIGALGPEGALADGLALSAPGACLLPDARPAHEPSPLDPQSTPTPDMPVKRRATGSARESMGGDNRDAIEPEKRAGEAVSGRGVMILNNDMLQRLYNVHALATAAALEAGEGAVCAISATVKTASDFRVLLFPPRAEDACDEVDIIEAARAAGHYAVRKAKPIRSWTWIHEQARRNRDARRASIDGRQHAGNPAGAPEREKPGADAAWDVWARVSERMG